MRGNGYDPALGMYPRRPPSADRDAASGTCADFPSPRTRHHSCDQPEDARHPHRPCSSVHPDSRRLANCWRRRFLAAGVMALTVATVSLQAQGASEPTITSRNLFADLIPEAKKAVKTTAGGLTRSQAECVLRHLGKAQTDTAVLTLLTICKAFPK